MWVEIDAKNEKVNIDIFGDIGGFGLNAETFISNVATLQGKELVLNISSLGGSVNDAIQIHDFLASYPNNVTAKISGLTASSATIIAMAAKEILMSENSLFLIHNVWTPATSGNAEQLEKEADSLRQIDDILINIYKKKTKKQKNTIARLMAEERWLDAEEALKLGFIDKIYIPSKEIINSLILNKIEENKLPKLPVNYTEKSETLHNKKNEKMSLEKINEKVDLIINKIEGLFVKESTEVEMINKSEAESTIQAEIEELRGAYEFQLELKEEAVKLANQNLEEKETEISNLKNSFEENLKDLTEKVERLEAVETKAVKEEDVVQEAAPESNPFDGFAEKLRV